MGPYVFFIVAAGIWIACGCALATGPVVLDRAWAGFRRLPLAAKPVLWILSLPWLRALAVSRRAGGLVSGNAALSRPRDVR